MKDLFTNKTTRIVVHCSITLATKAVQVVPAGKKQKVENIFKVIGALLAVLHASCEKGCSRHLNTKHLQTDAAVGVSPKTCLWM